MYIVRSALRSTCETVGFCYLFHLRLTFSLLFLLCSGRGRRWWVVVGGYGWWRLPSSNHISSPSYTFLLSLSSVLPATHPHLLSPWPLVLAMSYNPKIFFPLSFQLLNFFTRRLRRRRQNCVEKKRKKIWTKASSASKGRTQPDDSGTKGNRGDKS